MAEEAKRLKPGQYIISSKLQLPTENNVIGVKDHLDFESKSSKGEDGRVPVMYIPRPFRSSSWTITEADDGGYVLQLEGYDAVAQGDLLFGEKGGKMTWKINPQKNDTEIPLDLYTIESASEPGAGWFLDTNQPDENTQLSYGPLLYLPMEPKQYVSNALWFFIQDDAEAPVVV